MGKITNISGREAVKAFARAGWQTAGQLGSHLVMTKPGVRANLSVPQHKELSRERFAHLFVLQRSRSMTF